MTFILVALPFLIWLIWILLLLSKAAKELAVVNSSTLIHCTDPPNHFSPTAMYFIENQRAPHLIIPLWTLAARGNLTIRCHHHQQKSTVEPDHNSYYLEYTRNQEQTALSTIPLSEAEQKLFGILRWQLLEQPLKISPTNRREFVRLEEIFKQALETEFENFHKTYFPYQKLIIPAILFGIITSGLFFTGLPNLASMLFILMTPWVSPLILVMLVVLLIWLLFLFNCPTPEGQLLMNRLDDFKTRLQSLNLEIKPGKRRSEYQLERDLVYAITFYSPKEMMRQFKALVQPASSVNKPYIPYPSLIQEENNPVTAAELSNFFELLSKRMQATLYTPSISTGNISGSGNGGGGGFIGGGAGGGGGGGC